ncbi:MAG: hypothetical protein V4560_14695 [Bacteroidota bacterium]
MDKRKNNKGQPKKPKDELKVPLVFHVMSKNKDRLKKQLTPTVKSLDV